MLVSVVLVGCTTVPMARSVAVYRMKGSTLEHYQADDARCRAFAAAPLGPSPDREAMPSAAATTAVLRAVSGALIGAGTGSAARGVAMGAGTSLAAGAALGTVGARQAGWERQQRDDDASTAWMSASAPQVSGAPVQ
jgi:hypothetical protein